MAKASKARKASGRNEWHRRDGETHLQWQSRITRQRQEERDANAPIVPIEAARHGAYIDEFIHHDESGSKAQAKRNLKASPLAMWKAQGMLTATQEAAIAYCIRLWEFLPPMPATTAQYGERIPSNDSGQESEQAVNAFLDALADLRRVEGYIPRSYWQVFENCIRFDEPAGVAGSSLGYTGRSGKAKAHVIVCFVADIISMKEGL